MGIYRILGHILLVIYGLKASFALDCLSCAEVTSVSECHSFKTCNRNEQCYTDVNTLDSETTYSLGCKPPSECPYDAISMIGRRQTSNSSMTDCNQCCGTDFCNKHLCQHSDNECKDSPEFNCELIEAAFNICLDIHHAKTVCKKWCGLCDLVDGKWGEWSEWSGCQQTCGDTHRVRQRKCDNPPPIGGGLDCPGQADEYDNCTLEDCPIHGSWSEWSPWNPCSVTCGVGLIDRERKCDSPAPDNGGDHCFGHPNEYTVCYSRACVDGGWSTWSEWSACSASCDSGLQSRIRSCDNPKPSLLGVDCPGNNIEYVICSSQDCNHETDTPSIYFSVNTPSGYLFNENIPEFDNIVINEGQCYDPSTGRFNATIAGVYEFSVIFITSNSSSQCLIRKNRTVVVYALTHTESGWKTASASSYVHLDEGDVIDLSCGEWQYVDHNASTMFSGALVHADAIS